MVLPDIVNYGAVLLDKITLKTFMTMITLIGLLV